MRKLVHYLKKEHLKYIGPVGDMTHIENVVGIRWDAGTRFHVAFLERTRSFEVFPKR